MRVSVTAQFGTSVVLGAMAISMVSCGLVKPNAGDESTVSIRFPAVSSSNELRKPDSVGTLSAADFAKSCFIVNVTGSGITAGMNPDAPVAAGANCDVIKRGVFKGSVKPGDQIAVTVPYGTARKLEVFAYQRDAENDPCPALGADFGKLSKEKIIRVGLVETFDTTARDVVVPVELRMPASGVNIITQYGMSLACVSPATPFGGRGSAGLTLGSGSLKSASNRYRVELSVSGLRTKPDGQDSLQGSKYKVELDRGSQ